MKFGILTQWFDPEPGGGAIAGSLARELSRRGHDVKVLTGFPNYPSGTIYPSYSLRPIQDSFHEGFDLRRVALYPSHDESTFHRLLNYGSFAMSATALGVPWLRGLDALWVYNSPASIALPMWSAKYLLGVPHVLHVMDLWPDSIFLSDFGDQSRLAPLITRGLEKWCQKMYGSASSVAYVSRGMGLELAQRGVSESKLHYVPVWADEGVAVATEPTARSTWGVKEEELIILYAGALGASQGLETLIEGLALVRNRVKVTCLIAGSGTAESSLRALTSSRGLDNVHFLGQVPREQMTGIAHAADLHVVILRDFPLSGITMPSKIQTTLACGKPFIAALPGDARMAALQSNAAFMANPGDAQSIAEAILTAVGMGRVKLAEMGRRGAEHYGKIFALGLGVDRLEMLLIEAARAKGSHGPTN
jgi:glycosyltransferase involved in cell wall biosynthesis